MTLDNKKQRLEKKQKRTERSKIFQPFRALGYITNDIPFAVESRGQDYFMTTSVGHNFQTYNVSGEIKRKDACHCTYTPCFSLFLLWDSWRK